MKNLLKAIVQKLPYLRNKYFLSIVVFIVWMAFFDQYDLKTIFKLREDLKEIEESNAYYETQIEETKNQLKELKTNPKAVEKLARERYLMKKNDEDIFVIEPKKEAE